MPSTKQLPGRRQPVGPETETEPAVGGAAELLDGIDDLLDEIDGLLEDQSVLTGYRQRAGQ
jgi:hypothetical protein